MGGGSDSSSAANTISVDTTHNIPVAVTTALPFKSSNSNKNKPTTTNTTSSGSYALGTAGTAGTAGAPKGFVNINNNGVLGEYCEVL